jgi:hypothetical protein
VKPLSDSKAPDTPQSHRFGLAKPETVCVVCGFGVAQLSTPIENCMDLAAENCMPTIFIAA